MASPAVRSQSTLVVVVDGDDAERRDLAYVLGNAGFSVVQAAGGVQAIALLTTLWERIGLVISAVLMPGLSGKELRSIVAERWPRVAVLLVSGSGGALDEHLTLPKPYAAEALIERLRALLPRPPDVGSS